MAPRLLWLLRRSGHVLLAEHRLWTWTWPDDAAPLPVFQVPETHEHPAKTSGRFQVFVKGVSRIRLKGAMYLACSGSRWAFAQTRPLASLVEKPVAHSS